MKEYKIKIGCFLKILNYDKYYVINNNLHGIYKYFSNDSKYYLYKGYYNMGIEYSHWIEYKTSFKYYL